MRSARRTSAQPPRGGPGAAGPLTQDGLAIARVRQATGGSDAGVSPGDPSAAMLRSILAAAPAGVGLASNRVFRLVNQQLCEMTGYTEAELVGMSTRILYPDDESYESVGERGYAKLARHGRATVETRCRRKDGTVIDILLNLCPVDGGDPPGQVAFTVLDVTDWKRAEAALRREKEYADTIVDCLPGLFTLFDEAGNLLRWNKNLETLTGLTAAELAGRRYDSFCPPEEHARARAVFEASLSHGAASYEGAILTRGGGTIPMFVNAARVNLERGACVVAVGLDLTEQRRAERERAELEAQLRQAQKMEAVGQLASGIAHDFNNLLTVIFANLELFELELPQVAARGFGDRLNDLRDAARQAVGVTRALLTFARSVPAEKRPVDLAAAVRCVTRLVARMLPATIALRVEIEEEERLWASADEVQLQQVVMNLVVNARDAMPGGGQLRVVLRRAAAPAPDPGPAAADWAQITVSDTGVGMSPEAQARVFEPFFTTKPRGLGTGLGLPVVHGIVSDHGGQVRIESSPGRGTAVHVLLPLTTLPCSDAPPCARAALARGGGELILLAEDDRYLAQILATRLTGMGYRVQTVFDARRLLRAARTQGTAAGLLLVDVDLPGGSGLECVHRIRRRGCETPALLITGNPDLMVRPGATLPAHTRMLRKPFQVGELVRLAGECIRAARGTEARR